MTNHSTVVKNVCKFDIEYGDIIVINTDNAGYIQCKVFSAVWGGLLYNIGHFIIHHNKHIGQEYECDIQECWSKGKANISKLSSRTGTREHP